MLAILFAVGLAYSDRTHGHLFATGHAVASTKAMYLAESGIAFALPQWRGWSLPCTRRLTLTTGYVDISVQKIGPSCLIVSQGESGGVSHRISVQTEESGGIVMWRERTW